jgi:formylglycine-generating enzyme required for sulfatase activity
LAKLRATAHKQPAPGKLLEKMGFVRIGTTRVWIRRYEVSNSEYARFLGRLHRQRKNTRPYWPQEWEQTGELVFYRTRQHGYPVAGVSFKAAVAYGTWRTSDLRKQLPGVIVRLPTEAEWQAAARDGSPKRVYPWGDKWDPKRAVWKPRGREETRESRGKSAVALRGATPKGKLLHMAGNVSEWTTTVWRGEDGKRDASKRVLKGGSFNSFRQELLRIDAREPGGLTNTKKHWGFRVVIEFKK